MTDYLTDNQVMDIVHGYTQKTVSYSMHLIRLIMMDFLSDRERVAIYARFYNGQTYREIAWSTGYSGASGARGMVMRALDTILYYYPKYKNKDQYQIVYADGKISTKNF